MIKSHVLYLLSYRGKYVLFSDSVNSVSRFNPFVKCFFGIGAVFWAKETRKTEFVSCG